MSRAAVPRILLVLMDRIDPAIAEDLIEEYEDFILPRRGKLRAQLWLWSHSLRNAARGLITAKHARHNHRVSKDSAMNSFLQDLKFGMRLMVRSPLTSMIAILTIGIGVGLSTHTFATVWGSVLRPLPLPGGDRLVRVDWITENGDLALVHIADYHELRESAESFDELGGYTFGTANLASPGLPPERYRGAWVTDNLFDHLGAQAVLGRSFQVGDGAEGAEPVVLLSRRLWNQRFDASEQIIGQTVTVNGVERTVVGVMQEGFHFPFDEDLWMPAVVPETIARSEPGWLNVVGKLKPGVAQEAATTEVSSIAARIAADYPATNANRSAVTRPYREGYMPSEIVAVNLLMLACVFAVLLIACANVANLLLARAMARTREVAVRTALGASRGRILRQMVAEATVISALGGVLGIAIAQVANNLLNGFLVDITKPYWIDIRLDPATAVAAIVATSLAAMLAGLLPALRAVKMNTSDQLRAGGRGAADHKLGGATSLMVVSQIALSTALLVGAGLMTKSVANFRNVELGFDASQIFSARLGISPSEYPEPEDRLAFYSELVDRLEALPGVESVALTSNAPGISASDSRFSVSGITYESDARPAAWHYTVSPEYFSVLGVEVLEGRALDRADSDDGLSVAVVSNSFAQRYLDGDALGRQFTTEGETLTVVGVVADTYVGSGVGGIGDDKKLPEQIYVPHAQMPFGFMTLLIRTRGQPTDITEDVRTTVAAMDSNTPIYNVGALDELIDSAAWAFKLFGVTFGIYGLVSLLLAAVGLFGVMEFNVRRRNREVGIRMALGAKATQILSTVSARGMTQLTIGLAVGLGLGAVAAKPLSYVLYGVGSGDAGVFIAIGLTLAVFGTAACLIPASRALRCDPTVVLKEE